MIKPIKGRAARDFELDSALAQHANSAEHCQVYALFTEPVGGHVYVKVGLSRCASARAAAIQASCPLPINTALVAWVPNRKSSWALEAYLHVQLEDFHCSREWFKFPQSVDAKSMIEQGLKDGARQICGVANIEPVSVDGESEQDRERNRQRHRAIFNQFARQRLGESDCYIVGDVDMSAIKVFQKKRLTIT